MAGNETEGLRYGVIETREKHWLRWREEDAHPAAEGNPLLRELGQICRKERLLEIVHDFMVFDAGVKKTCRHNQYFGVRAAGEHVARRDGGIIWHTQGSGKSLTMVWLAKWIREHVTGGRVVIITDRTELDRQIEMVFKGVEARDIDQSISSEKKVDEWFEIKTRGLSDLAKAQVKQRWGTLRKVLSSRDRLSKIVADIHFDMATRDRLLSGHGNALLVSDSIYAACRLFEMFQQTDLAGKCAVVTSYEPMPADIKGEESGEGYTEKLRRYEIYRKILAAHFGEPEETAMYKVDRFEEEVKQRFVDEPGRMKLLIVVDKLLTGFDAPPAGKIVSPSGGW